MKIKKDTKTQNKKKMVPLKLLYNKTPKTQVKIQGRLGEIICTQDRKEESSWEWREQSRDVDRLLTEE